MKLLDGLPKHHFGAIEADPPWHFKSYSACANPQSDRKVKYRTMTIDDIKALPIADLAAPTGCHLFLWATGPCLPQALEVMQAWGFQYSGIAFAWVKLRKTFAPVHLKIISNIEKHFHVGLGFTTRHNVELVLLGRRGNARRISKSVRELVVSPRREHSRKPDEVAGRIEQYCEGPYLELFARSHRKGWTCCGDEVGKFDGK